MYILLFKSITCLIIKSLMMNQKYCKNCEEIVYLTEDGYCTSCGNHADNI